jgi:hypothetical protein
MTHEQIMAAATAACMDRPRDNVNGRERSSRAEAADDWPASTTAQWPAPLKNEAFHGPAGDLVRTIEPHSESDSAALLVQSLASFGNLIGRSAYFKAEADKHHMNLFVNLVGLTAKGRKGTSWGQVKRMHRDVDEEWATARVTSGLSSGEGLIWAVRDEIRGLNKKHVEEVLDPGVQDKRLLVLEGEFSRVLQSVERQGNTLSAVLRDSWDTGTLSCLTKNSPARATGAHISTVGHITKDELKRLLTETSMANGFANRFLWVCSRRSKALPEGGALDTVDLKPLIRRLKSAADFARTVGEMKRDARARVIWREVYPDLSEGKPGLLGAVTSRAEAQVLRLSCIYALLDSSETVQAEHLLAALAVWEYCEQSARFVFGAALGDATADEILRVLRSRTEGMTRTEVSDYFQRNKSATEIARALGVLQEYGRVRVEREQTDGRARERWYAI